MRIAFEAQIVKAKSRWNTSHECEMCGKTFCGIGAALVELEDGRDRIICMECLDKVQTAESVRKWGFVQ